MSAKNTSTSTPFWKRKNASNQEFAPHPPQPEGGLQLVANPRFPLSTLMWLVPGIVGAIIMAALVITLGQRGQRLVAYITPAGSLASIQLDGANKWVVLTPTLPAGFAGYRPEWSNDGETLAITGQIPNGRRVFLARPKAKGTDQFTQTVPLESDKDWTTNPVNGSWSANSRFLTLLSPNPRTNYAEIAFFDQSAKATTVISDTAVDLSSSIEWNPTASQIVATLRYSNEITRGVYIIGPSLQPKAFSPEDHQAIRVNATWSYSGTRIAYTARVSPTVNDINGGASMTGSIWIANADGSAPAQLVDEGPNYASHFAPGDNFLFFTRFLTPTQSYELAAYNLLSNTIYATGPIAQQSKDIPINLKSILKWSPDKKYLAYIGYDVQSRARVYLTDFTGSAKPQVVYAESASNAPISMEWLPNNRALLIGSPTKGLYTVWLNNREDHLADGYNAASP